MQSAQKSIDQVDGGASLDARALNLPRVLNCLNHKHTVYASAQAESRAEARSQSLLYAALSRLAHLEGGFLLTHASRAPVANFITSSMT